jgi:RNA-directed DNA polymerase
VKDTSWEETPVGVTERSKQTGDIRVRWTWVEPTVWTERMLAALEIGVKGGVWFSLVDKVYAPRVLEAAWRRVRKNRGSGGVDRVTVDGFAWNLEDRLSKLSRHLKEGTYVPLPIWRTWIPKPDKGKRPLGIPAVCDRVVQTALRYVLEPIFERMFCEHSYGFRPSRGAKDALRRVDQFLKRGYRYVIDVDLKSYFDTIPHGRLMELVEERIADGRILALLRAYLKQGILEGMRSWTPTRGTPQGAVISPLLANIYLHSLDRLMEEAGFEMTRYADDFIVQCRTAEEAQRAMEMIRQWVDEAGLTLHPEKTRVVDMTKPGGFDFLGYHFERGKKYPRKSSLKKFKDTIRRKTKRNNGRRLEDIIESVNRTSRGWYEYFKHSDKHTFERLDPWIRMRLRSILRKRKGDRGRGRGQDHHRWPNAYFAGYGLFAMLEAHASACQSLRAH